MRTSFLIAFYALFAFIPFTFSVAFAGPFAIDADLGGVSSKYTAFIAKLAKTLMSQGIDNLPDGKDVSLKCWETPQADTYIGLEQAMTIEAPLSTVTSVLDDFEHYQELFPDFKEIRVTARQENRTDTYWEQRIPLFFVPNVKYEMIYLNDTSQADRKIYRYQLKQKKTIEASDGLILVQKKSDQKTGFREYDFVDADWGPARVLGKTKIWNESVEGIYISDLAVKVKAENPTFNHKQSLEEARRLSNEETFKNCVKNRKMITSEFGT